MLSNHGIIRPEGRNREEIDAARPLASCSEGAGGKGGWKEERLAEGTRSFSTLGSSLGSKEQGVILRPLPGFLYFLSHLPMK
ncbi:hypothetical protein DMN91_010669 [Ooceraea biroi]|uniref:Uncharacterized protein n=1 Tax=Ooceraea biroi TaxID=2015173 RepID=A0A3L8D8J3_OOCBI|nr:hypothetical protein DMN91_010669 [Ooceraea biroi]